MVRLLTIAAMAGFASVCYFLAISLVRNASGLRLVARWSVVFLLALAVCGLVMHFTNRPFDVVIGFLIGGNLTPIVHRAIKTRAGLRHT